MVYAYIVKNSTTDYMIEQMEAAPNLQKFLVVLNFQDQFMA